MAIPKIILGASDEDADWIKFVDPETRQRELEVYVDVAKILGLEPPEIEPWPGKTEAEEEAET